MPEIKAKKNLLEKIALIGAEAGDSEELRLQKSLLVLSTIPFIISGASWGFMYILFDEITAGLIPLSYSIFSFASLVLFGITGRFRIFRFSQLFLILLLPFALMIALGGFVNGSAVILWAFFCPLGAMLFEEPNKAWRWLLAFILLVIVSVYLQPLLRHENNLSIGQINLFFVINLAGVSTIVFIMVWYFVERRNFFRDKSESLLLNILPKEIAEELKNNGTVESKYFENVTVMFTDIKDFTQITEMLSPAELVSEIDSIFRAFDKIISEHNIEKIKIIGDSYMCAGGLPLPNKTHATDVVNAAIEINKFMKNHLEKRKSANKQPFVIRIGIHTGSVVAGVVGDRKFAYDIWGDTVNIASRMESSGEAGKINISGNTYALVKDKFNCSYRGKIKAKHKGEIDMYFVEDDRINIIL